MTALVRWTVLLALLALRIPSLVQPAGADQSLYTYVGLRVLDGGTPYLDAWDQKPPGVHLLYALLWRIWPDERVVAASDLAAAVAVCWLLILIGRRVASTAAGWTAACVFALLANPSMYRMSGVFVRGQCETFIALAITGALALLCSPRRTRGALVAAGVLLGAAVWLKYNAIVFALPLLTAVWVWRRPGATVRDVATEWLLIAASTATVGLAGLAWLASRGALPDLWLATFVYNVSYSSEQFAGPGAFLGYLLGLPFRQARYELLWLIGVAGVPFALVNARTRVAGVVAALWIAAAVVAIALNGRDLPQYFIQASPALALAAGVGGAAAWQSRSRVQRAICVAILLLGFWRVGTEPPVAGVARLAGLPGLIDNVRFDLAHWRGRIDRATYLDRFGGQREQDKFIAGDVVDLAREVAATTSADDTIFVFGFSPGIYVKANRLSASRFFWSYPIVIEFAADRPGFGSQGLLEDLEASRPAVVILQKDEWGSDTFFTANPALSAWLERGYSLDNRYPRYTVWRRIGER